MNPIKRKFTAGAAASLFSGYFRGGMQFQTGYHARCSRSGPHAGSARG